jgi:hypothetical protein
VGSNDDDQVGEYITTLSNGNYVVRSLSWDNGTIVDAGATTWGDGASGVTGPVSAANSLVGSSNGDQVGEQVNILSNGSYVVNSLSWDNGTIIDAGAATWVNGTSGRMVEGSPAVGTPNNKNSIIGQAANAGMGWRTTDDIVNGSFLVSFFNEGSGRVRVGLVDPNQLTTSRAQGASLTITPAFVENTLAQGSDVTLQANQVIGLKTSLLVEVPSGDGGDLTLQAPGGITFTGSINLISDNGAVTFTGPVMVSSPVAVNAGTSSISFTGSLVVSDTLQLVAGNPVQLGTSTHLDGGTIQASPGVVVGDGDRLSGQGSLDGELIVESGGTLVPGLSVGEIEIGDLTLQSGAILNLDLNGQTAGSGYDQVMVAGAVSLGGSQLQVSLGFNPPDGHSFVIIANDGGEAVSGTFDGLAEGEIFTADGTWLRISYQGGEGNDVTLTVGKPQVVDFSPADGAQNVAINAPLVIIFNKAIDKSIFAFQVEPDPGGWIQSWSESGLAVTLNHNDFSALTTYTVTIIAADDLVGNPLSNAPLIWRFTTAGHECFLPIVSR